MAFRSARVNSDESESGGSSPTMESKSSESSTGGASGVPATSAAAESQFDVAAEGTGATLQRLAKQHGSERVHSWIDEGMPVETMGKARSMDEFRERQEARPPEVPKDVEQQNEASLHRSEKAQYDTGSAGDAGVPSSVRDVISSPGGDLDSEVKSGLEDRLGSSLDHVQVHTGPKAQEACQEVNARAFAVGNHIAFGPGEYDPSSPEGQHLIAHEVVHTLQQPDAAMSMMPKTQVDMEIDPDPQAEREADQVANDVMQGGELGVDSMRRTDVHVQRVVKGALSSVKGALSSGGGLDTEDVGAKEGLDERVYALADNQSQLIEEVNDLKQTAIEKVGVETGKGAVTGVGAVVGTVTLGPGPGTIAGGAVGGTMGGLYERLFQDVTETITEQIGVLEGAAADRLPQSLVDRQGGSGHGGNDPYSGGD